MTHGDPVTRDAALMILNDRCGQEVEISVEREEPFEGTSSMPIRLRVLRARGELRHWREADVARGGGVGARVPMNDVSGWYWAGDVKLVFGHPAAELLDELGGDGPYAVVFSLSTT